MYKKKTVWLPSLLLYVLAEPFQRGFYCDDTSIRYPYKDSTVNDAELIGFSIGLPILSVNSIIVLYILLSVRSFHCWN